MRDSAMKDQVLREGICPKCGETLARREGMFYLAELGGWPGLYCKSCNALWDDPDNSFLQAVLSCAFLWHH